MTLLTLLLACGGGGGLGRAALWDLDGDGVPVPVDCDDGDDSVGSPVNVYTDQDGDGYGDPATAAPRCVPGEALTDGSDCDDTNPNVSPRADETCNNGVDDNCDDDPAPCTPEGTVQAERSDVRLSGTEVDERFGRDIDVVPDLDGDGVDELLVGASGIDSTDSGAGAVYLFRGPLTEPRSAPSADATLWGDARYGSAGTYVEAAGDVDGDGEGDLLVTCDATTDYTGHSHLELGPFSGEGELAGVRLTGEMYDYLGPIVARLDFDGSGGRDFAVGSPGYDDTSSMSRDWGAVLVYTRLPSCFSSWWAAGTARRHSTMISGLGDVQPARTSGSGPRGVVRPVRRDLPQARSPGGVDGVGVGRSGRACGGSRWRGVRGSLDRRWLRAGPGGGTEGARSLRFRTGRCAGCPEASLLSGLLQLAENAQVLGLHISGPVPAVPVAAPDPRARSLRGARARLRGASKRLEDATGAPPRRAALVAHSRATGVRLPPQVTGGTVTVAAGCTGCTVCAALCPTGAMTRAQDGASVTLTHDSLDCIACTICTDACPEAAISVQAGAAAPVPGVVAQVALAACRLCGVLHAPGATHAGLCPPCLRRYGPHHRSQAEIRASARRS